MMGVMCIMNINIINVSPVSDVSNVLTVNFIRNLKPEIDKLPYDKAVEVNIEQKDITQFRTLLSQYIGRKNYIKTKYNSSTNKLCIMKRVP